MIRLDSKTWCDRVALLSRSPCVAQTVAAAQVRWDDVLRAAEKEGEVTVYATNSVGDLPVIWDAFKKKFPKIKLNSVGDQHHRRDRHQSDGGAAREPVSRRRGARRAGGDVQQSPSRQGARSDCAGVDTCPKSTDLSKWWKGKHRYVDPEGQYVFVYQSSLYGPPVYHHTKLLNLDSIRSVWDLLDPKWKGKMIGLWPRANYVSTALLFMYHHPQIGPKFLERFYGGEMDITYFSDFRQGTDWLAAGKVSALFSLPAAARPGTRAAGGGNQPLSFQRSSGHRLE